MKASIDSIDDELSALVLNTYTKPDVDTLLNHYYDDIFKSPI